MNAAYLIDFNQEPSPEAQALIDAREDGVIFADIFIDGANSLLLADGNPEWRGTASLTWRLGSWGAGVFARYVGEVNDTSATLSDGTPFRVEDWAYANVYVQYTFDDGPLDGTRLRVGVRNITDEDPPLADNNFGYIGDLHSNRGRSFYGSVRTRF